MGQFYYRAQAGSAHKLINYPKTVSNAPDERSFNLVLKNYQISHLREEKFPVDRYEREREGLNGQLKQKRIILHN